jgi:uncharacterized caspase-like protein
MASTSSTSIPTVNKKRALVIGNNSYRQGRTLRYCISNACDIHEKLQSIQFQVTLGIDLTYEQMETMIDEFSDSISSGDLVVFFFTGYGTHCDGQNYILSTDDQYINAFSMFKYQAIDVYHTFERIMKCSPSSAIFVLDACRIYVMPHVTNEQGSNDFGGFLRMDAFDSSMIIFACDINKTISDKSTNGRNSCFVNHLLEHIDQPNLSVNEMMNRICSKVMVTSKNEQCPFQVCALRKNVYLNYQIESGKISSS